MKTIGILTSGGDAPGMNAAVRAVTRTALSKGMTVKGIMNGYEGLMTGEVFDMDVTSVSDITLKGGTILGSARALEMKSPEGQDKAVATIKEHGIEGIVVIGGDGSFMGANVLHERGIKTIGIPGTIDNDMGYTEATVGFYTACETVKEAASKIIDTANSHSRCIVVEVMGRNCGDIALYSGIASGAESILVPEVPYDLDEVCQRILRNKERGKRQHLIIVAEGVEDIPGITKAIEERTGVESRQSTLGHMQRGGSPVMYDALIASQMGVRAVELLEAGESSQAIGIKEGKVFNMPITEAVNTKRVFDQELYQIAKTISN